MDNPTPDPRNKDLDSVIFPDGKAYWVESVEMMPDGMIVVWLENCDPPWVSEKELTYDPSRKQFEYRP